MPHDREQLFVQQRLTAGEAGHVESFSVQAVQNVHEHAGGQLLSIARPRGRIAVAALQVAAQGGMQLHHPILRAIWSRAVHKNLLSYGRLRTSPRHSAQWAVRSSPYLF